MTLVRRRNAVDLCHSGIIFFSVSSFWQAIILPSTLQIFTEKTYFDRPKIVIFSRSGLARSTMTRNLSPFEFLP